jgi:serine/threonine protein kinase
MKIIKKIAGDCVAALRKIHSKKLYHGHIKTGNILVNEEEEYNLSDLSVFS